MPRYGPFARLADWLHGWRDGRLGIPAYPTGRRGDEDRIPVTTAHREYLIRMAQDAFNRERVALEASRLRTAMQLGEAALAMASAQLRLTRAEADLAEATRPLTEEEANRRETGESRTSQALVRRRRLREWRRRKRQAEARFDSIRAAFDRVKRAHAAAETALQRHAVVTHSRVVRIQEHYQRRIAAYRRRLARSHPDGPWANTVLGVRDPRLPGWAVIGAEQPEQQEPEATTPPRSPRPAPRPSGRHELGDVTTFGSGDDDDVQRTDFYYAQPRHFELRRRGEGFLLVDHGWGHGPYIGGRPVDRRTRLATGATFEFGGRRYEISADGKHLTWTWIGPYSLVVHEVWAYSGTKPRLSRMSIVQPGEQVLAILGPSGAGKTSLFYALMRELRPRGTILFQQLDLSTHGEQLRDHIGFVPQDDHLHRTLSVERLLRFSDMLRSPKRWATRDDRIEKVCRLLQIDGDRLKQKVGTLSGGQRKRVSIALELLASPDLLLLDEPTSGLDAGMDREVMNLLGDYSRERPAPENAQESGIDTPGRLVIVITHTTEHLASVVENGKLQPRVDQVLVLASEGRAIHAGPPEGLLAALGQRSYADLMTFLSSENDQDLVQRLADEYADRAAKEAAKEIERIIGERDRMAARAPRRLPVKRFLIQLGVLIWRQTQLLVARGTAKNDAELGRLGRLAAPLVAGLPFIVAAGGALIAALVSKTDGLARGPSVAGSVSLLITLCVLSGQALTYSDIVSEFHVIKREHRTGTLTLAVVVSKWLVFFVAAVIQAALITVIFVRLKPAPERSLFVSPALELFLNLAMMTVVAMTLGLLISTVSRTVEQAVNWNTFVTIGQIALNGVAADLSGGGLAMASMILPARWGLAATSSSIDLLTVRGAPPGSPADALWQHTTGQWITDTVGLLALGAVFFVLTVVLLRSKLKRPD